MKKGMFLSVLFGLLAAVVAIVPELALAQSTNTVGGDLMEDIATILRGNLGTLIGLAIALLGLYMWLVQQSSWGIVMIIGGVALTAFPGFFNTMQDQFSTLFNTTAATTGDTSTAADGAFGGGI